MVAAKWATHVNQATTLVMTHWATHVNQATTLVMTHGFDKHQQQACHDGIIITAT